MSPQRQRRTSVGFPENLLETDASFVSVNHGAISAVGGQRDLQFERLIGASTCPLRPSLDI